VTRFSVNLQSLHYQSTKSNCPLPHRGFHIITAGNSITKISMPNQNRTLRVLTGKFITGYLIQVNNYLLDVTFRAQIQVTSISNPKIKVKKEILIILMQQN